MTYPLQVKFCGNIVAWITDDFWKQEIWIIYMIIQHLTKTVPMVEHQAGEGGVPFYQQRLYNTVAEGANLVDNHSKEIGPRRRRTPRME